MEPTVDQMSITQLLEFAQSGALDISALISAATRLIAQGQRPQAIALYRSWLKNPRVGLEYAALFNLGILLAEESSMIEAEAAYRQAVTMKKDFPQGHYNLGAHLEKQGRIKETVAQWSSMLDDPEIKLDDNPDIKRMVLNGLGRIHDKYHNYADGEDVLRQSLELVPTQEDVLYHWLHIRQKKCEWPVMRPLPKISVADMWEAISPLAILGLSDDPARLLSIANHFAETKVIKTARMVPFGHRYGHEKPRIGFVSGDFCLHAVSLLTVRLYELIDRNKYEVYGFGWSRVDGTALRARVLESFDHYISIEGIDDANAAELIRQNEIDIVFDLQGLTAGTRPNIIARGPAPFQIAYLGYPGTSGLPYVDYVIADKFIFPPELEPFFTEKPLYMPDCYQVSDDQRVTGGARDTDKYNLPSDKFIFCAFNNNHKITPEMFESWMRILRQSPNSILWLLKDNEWSEANMTAAAKAHGVNPDRLYFAGRVSPDDYLRRYGTADLFLDTFPFNAGTTANDALWAGLPIVTLSGRTYVSRMAGSLLHSTGLAHLVTFTREDYEAKAIAYANDPGLQDFTRKTLAAAKLTSSALNPQKFVDDLDLVLQHMLTQGDGSDLLRNTA